MKKSYLHLILAGVTLSLFTGIVVIGFFAEAYDSSTYPTMLFIASYDWLHNFYDNNAQSRDSRTDHDTDNFNKIIVVDSNLFPIMTALFGDNEYPNISGRNAVTWATGVPSSYSPSVNDYFNRSIAVAPDFSRVKKIKYQTNPDDTRDTKKVYQYGIRKFMEWAFVVDPGNHNIRRYEFQKSEGFWSFDPSSDVDGPLIDIPNIADYKGGIEQGDCVETKLGGCDTEHWYLAPLENVWPGTSPWQLTMLKHSYQNDPIFYLPRWATNYHETSPDAYTTYAAYTSSPVLDITVTITEDEDAVLQNYTIQVFGNSSDQKDSVIYLGVNSGFDESENPYDPQPLSSRPVSPYIFETNGATAGERTLSNPTVTYMRDRVTYTIPRIDINYDVDPDEEGIQVRLSLYPQGGGGIAIDWIGPDEDDFAFAVKQDPNQPGGADSRWRNISAFLETVPPESFAGYPSYTSSTRRIVGYGYKTNTSFSHANNIRFKNPRDIDVYRDVFDTSTSVVDNGAPLYIFVADTMNSRIQVFMNATASAGVTGAPSPIRPVRVRGPNFSDFNTNELAMRPSGGGYGDGRKADWRQYTTALGTTYANSEIPANAGRGEFYYPHGVAVDQDPDTKDVYLFVADTYNHRIQVFRDATGVTFQSITSKRFDFRFEAGWGTYPPEPIFTSYTTMSPPGPYHFRYPKGLDIVRFNNNSSYLYVVDSKNYRLMKYLITERPAGAPNYGGINSITVEDGYGYNGTNFVNALTANSGEPLAAHGTTVGFLNPQDVTTGYSGFYTYSTEDRAHDYQRSLTVNGQEYGLKYLNNYMVYVTDYARNNTSLARGTLNMRVMRFLDNFRNYDMVYIPWEKAATNIPFDKGSLGQSVLGVSDGVYNSAGGAGSTGSTENAGQDGFFTDRPVGMAALAWNTEMLDMRVVDTGVTPNKVYPNGTTIPPNTTLRIGARTQRYFGLPNRDPATYIGYTAQLDGRGIERFNVFCYNSGGGYLGYKTVTALPWRFNPNQISGCNTSGSIVKIIAEDALFTTSGKTGTMLFEVD